MITPLKKSCFVSNVLFSFSANLFMSSKGRRCQTLVLPHSFLIQCRANCCNIHFTWQSKRTHPRPKIRWSRHFFFAPSLAGSELCQPARQPSMHKRIADKFQLMEFSRCFFSSLCIESVQHYKSFEQQ